MKSFASITEWTTFRLGEPLLGGPAGAALAAALLFGAVALILFRGRAAGRREPVDRFLLALRLLAVGLVWALAVFDPVLVASRTEEIPGQTLIAVDLSSSMDATDSQRSLDEKLRLARVLGLADAATVEGWLAEIERGTTPAASAAVAARVDRLSRGDIARLLLNADGANLAARLEPTQRVTMVGFHRDLIDGLTPETLRTAPPPGETFETDLRVPLKQGLALAGDRAVKTLGVIVLSDGQHNKGAAPVDLARELRAASAPIFAVAIGSRTPPRDVAVAEVVAPAQAFKGAKATVETKIRVHGMAAQEIVVELFDAGPPRRLLERKTLAHGGADGAYVVRFPVAFADLGLRRLEVVATPGGKQTEVTTRNNTSAALVRVTEEKIRVLIVDEEVRWDTHYLTAALGRDTDVILERIIFDPPRLQSLKDDERTKAALPADRWPALVPDKDDPLWAFDVIVLGDVSPRHFPGAVQTRLEKYVAEREGTLIVQAGKRHFPDSGGTSEGRDVFSKMLPIDRPRTLSPKNGFQVLPTEAGWRLPFMALEDADAESRRRWSELPPLYWGVVGVPRPGAESLAQAASKSTPSPPRADEAVIALWNVGLGKVVWIGVDGTWRWRFRAGDRDHQRFWGQLVRWAGSESAGPDGRGAVTFGAKKPAYAAGQVADVFLNLGGKARNLNPATARFRIVQIGDDGKESLVQSGMLQQRDERRGQWEGKAVNLSPGSYRALLDVPELAGQAPQSPGQRDRFQVASPESGELADLATNAELLRTLAVESGGRLLWPEDIEQLPKLLERQVSKRDSTTEERLTRDPPWVWWVLGIVLGLLTLEWLIRKRVGLA